MFGNAITSQEKLRHVRFSRPWAGGASGTCLPAGHGRDQLSEGSVFRFAALDVGVIPTHHEIQVGDDDHHAWSAVAETAVQVLRCIGPAAAGRSSCPCEGLRSTLKPTRNDARYQGST